MYFHLYEERTVCIIRKFNNVHWSSTPSISWCWLLTNWCDVKVFFCLRIRQYVNEMSHTKNKPENIWLHYSVLTISSTLSCWLYIEKKPQVCIHCNVTNTFLSGNFRAFITRTSSYVRQFFTTLRKCHSRSIIHDIVYFVIFQRYMPDDVNLLLSVMMLSMEAMKVCRHSSGLHKTFVL